MPFAVEDFQDLLRLLEAHPEWRAELRRLVLSQELLELPSLVRQLVEAQARSEARLERVEQGQLRVEAALARLAEAQARTEQRVEELAQAQVRTEQRLEQLAQAHIRLDALLGRLEGDSLEQRYRTRGPAYFSELAKRLRVLDVAVLADLLDDAVEDGRLTEAERRALLSTDIVLTGRRREDQTEVYLVVEVSAGIGPHDVERAAERALTLAKLGRPVQPVVAGRSITPAAEALARKRGVSRVLDGQAETPD